MFQELIQFFKRFVVAHEKMAEAQMLTTRLLSAQTANEPRQLIGVDPAGYGQSDGMECTAGSPSPAETTQQSPAGTPAPDWNPYTCPVMKQYKGEKQGILKAELAKFGLDVGAKMTGAQMHELLLEKAKNTPKAEPAEPPQAVLPGVLVAPVMAQAVLPGVPVAPVMAPPATPAALEVPALGGVVDLDMIRGVINQLCMKGEAPRNEALRLLSEVGGVTRLTDAATGQQLLPNEKFVPLFNALTEANGRM